MAKQDDDEDGTGLEVFYVCNVTTNRIVAAFAKKDDAVGVAEKFPSVFLMVPMDQLDSRGMRS